MLTTTGSPARATRSQSSASCIKFFGLRGRKFDAVSPAFAGRLSTEVRVEANTSLCIVRGNAHVPPFDGVPASLPSSALGFVGVRLGGDGDDGVDPVVDRAGRQRD